jgi:hypothetical protein
MSKYGQMSEEYLLAVLTIVTSFFLILILFVLPDVGAYSSRAGTNPAMNERVRGAPQ